MALTPAEKQSRYRQRFNQRIKELEASKQQPGGGNVTDDKPAAEQARVAQLEKGLTEMTALAEARQKEIEQLKQAHLLLLNQKATKKLPRAAFRQILARLHPDSGGDAELFNTFKEMEPEWCMTAADEAAKKRTEQSKEMWDKAIYNRHQKLWEQRQREEDAKAERKAKRAAAKAAKG